MAIEKKLSSGQGGGLHIVGVFFMEVAKKY
jgi:hypothetical protein